jgi:hypothetical protein
VGAWGSGNSRGEVEGLGRARGRGDGKDDRPTGSQFHQQAGNGEGGGASGHVHDNEIGEKEGARGSVAYAPEVGGRGIRVPADDIKGRMTIDG